MTRNKKLVRLMALTVATTTVATAVPAYAAFDADYYAKQNPDVVAVVGTTPKALENHYNLFGKNEGRAASAEEANGSELRQIFDAKLYAQLYPDVVAVYGTDADKLFQHFLTFGINEGRKVNNYFDVKAYKDAYPDLQKAFGNNIAAYYKHFATFGIKEHRTAGGFPAENILPGGAKKTTVVASSGGGGGSSDGGASGGGSSSGGGTSIVPKSIEGVRAANESVSARLVNKGTDQNPKYEVSSEEEKVALINDAKAALQTANAVKEEKAAALKTAQDINKAADERLATAAAAVNKAGLNTVGATEAAALKTANEAYYGKGNGTGDDAGAKANLIAAQKAKVEADAALQTAKSNYDKAVAAEKTALDNAYTVLTGVCEVPKNMINEQDPDDVETVLGKEAAKLGTAETAAQSLLDNKKNIDSKKVEDAKKQAEETTLAAYQEDYLDSLKGDVLAGEDTTDAEKINKANAAKETLKRIYNAATVEVDNNAVVIKAADNSTITPDKTKITASDIGTWENAGGKDLATATAEAKSDIDKKVDNYNKAQAADKANTDLNKAKDEVSKTDKALNGDTTNNVSGAKKDASDAATALTEAQTAEAKAADDITKAQADLTKAYNDAKIKNEDNEDVALSSEQKAILAERDAAQTEVIKTEYDERGAQAEYGAADAAANTASNNYNTARTVEVVPPVAP